MSPRTVALVGASAKAGSIGARTLDLLLAQPALEAVYPVNPGRSELAGQQCYESVSALPSPPDAAVIALPAERALDALVECARCGVRSAVVLSAGFAELGDEGAAREHAIKDLADDSAMVVCGPNTIGLFNYREAISLSFVPSGRVSPVPDGRVALVSQSGALMAALANRFHDAGVELGYGVATGNEADLDSTEVLAHLVDHDEADVLVLVMETVRDGPRFVALCERLLELEKPLVVYKVGRSEAAGIVTRSHTGALAGSYPVLQAVFRHLGVTEAGDIDQVVDLAAGALAGRFPAGPGIGVVTSTGGGGAIAVDCATEINMVVPEPSAATAEAMRRLSPQSSLVGPVNPFDATGQAIEQPQLLGEIVEVMLADDSIDGVVVVNPAAAGAGGERAASLLRRAASTTKPVLQVILAGTDGEAMRRPLREGGIPVFDSPARAVASFAAMVRFGVARSRAPGRATAPLSGTPGVGSPIPGSPVSGSPASGDPASGDPALRDQLRALAAWPTEHRTKHLLAGLGIAVVREDLADSPDRAAEIAGALGYPVAVKVSSPDVVHKTEVGGVRLGLRDASAVRTAASEVLEALSRSQPTARVDGVLVSAMVDSRLELMAGVHLDPVFGPMVVLGLGGIFAEALDQVAMRPATLVEDDVDDLVAEAGLDRLLDAGRGYPGVDRAELVRLVGALSRLGRAGVPLVRDVDLNPVLVTPGGELVAVDASVLFEDR